MKLSILLNIGLVALTAAAPAPAPSDDSSGSSGSAKQCADTAVGNLKGVANKLNSTLDKVAAYEAKLLNIGQLLDVQKSNTQVANAIKTTTDSLNSCPQFDTENSIALSGATLDMLPIIEKTLDTIVNKKPEFDKAILHLLSASLIVKNDLSDLHEKTDALSDSIKKHLADELQPAVDDVAKKIDKWFGDAEKAYANASIL